MSTQDIVQLPHQHIGHLKGEDLKTAIERNFKEVAHMLYILQMYEKTTGKPINETVDSVTDENGNLLTSKLNEKLVGLQNELQLNDEAVTAAKLAVAAVIAEKIATGAITETKVANDAISTPKIQANAVTAAEIAANAVTAVKIAANAVIAEKIAANAVTADKINVNELAAITAYLGKVTSGEVYSTLFKSGTESSTDYVEITAGDSPVKVVEGGKTALELWTSSKQGLQGSGGSVLFRDVTADDERCSIGSFNDEYPNSNGYDGLIINAEDSNTNRKDVVLAGNNLRLDFPTVYIRQANSSTDVVIEGSLSVDDIVSSLTIGGDLTISGYLESTGNVVTVDDNFHATGHITCDGTKFAAQKTASYGVRCLAARESPDVRYIIEGTAQFINGECRIDINPIFLECIEPHSDQTKWIFNLTALSEFMNMRISEIGDTYFIAQEKDGSNGQFSWSLSAVRKGCAGDWLPEK